MDIESLKIFLDVCENGNLTRAANSRYITQSALSKRIAALEKELGVLLFYRGKGKTRAVATPAGKAFVDIAQRMVMLYSQALELGRAQRKTFLTIACIHSVQDALLPKFLLQLNDALPDLCITVEDHHTAEIISLVENRRVEIGIAHAAAPFYDLESELLYDEGYCVVMKKDENRPSTAIHPRELAAAHEIFQEFDGDFESWHDGWWHPYQAKIRVNTTPTAMQYFSHPNDWMAVPEMVARAMTQSGFACYPLSVPHPRHRVFMIYSKQAGNPNISAFTNMAKEYFSQLLKETL